MNDKGKTLKNDKYAIDKLFHAQLSKVGGWLSPSSFLLAYLDWLSHIAISPVKQSEISVNYYKNINELINCLSLHSLSPGDCSCFPCKPNDSRFQNKLWQRYPFNAYERFFLFLEKTCDEVTKNVRGVSSHHEYILNFVSRQILDMYSPSNFPWSNPEVLSETAQKRGLNLIEGYKNLSEDIHRSMNHLPVVGSENFKVGSDVAITKGKVIFRNSLVELIQYSPTTEKVYREPVLIVPACIMKYYILDLSPHNSMVKYLVDQGHTVFMISWKNPTEEDRDLSIEDYINQGILSSLDVVSHVIPNTKINAVGYCIGGTFLMMAASAMAGKFDDRLKSITLFAAQIDFKDAGELLLFIDPSQLTYLEDIMWEKGYLDGTQMGGAFSMLHATDLVWSRMVRDYLLGERKPLFDLMAWDYDTTRLPYKMHSEYLRRMFLHNDLVENKFTIGERKIALQDVKVPIFAVSTLTDHVAPWGSVYKIHYFTGGDITFVLTTGGHNAGIVSEPGHPNRSFRMLLTKKENKRLSTKQWQKRATYHEGSWWENWHLWLASMSNEQQVDIPPMGNEKMGINIICDAPGTYVLQR